MNNLDEQVFSIVKKYMERNESLTEEGIKLQLPTVDMEDIRASLQRLQDDGRVVGMPLNACLPNSMEDATADPPTPDALKPKGPLQQPSRARGRHESKGGGGGSTPKRQKKRIRRASRRK